MPVMLAARLDPTYRPTLRVIDVVAIIVGTVVGAGIFRTPSLVAANAPSEAAVLGAWAMGGAISLIGALCYAELAAAYPSPGGDYHYLARAFGMRLAFLFAWARITVIQTGSIALLAFVIGDYASKLAPLGPASPTLYAALTVALITGVHVVGVRQGRLIQNLLTGAEVAGLLLVIAAPSWPSGPAAKSPLPLEPEQSSRTAPRWVLRSVLSLPHASEFSTRQPWASGSGLLPEPHPHQSEKARARRSQRRPATRAPQSAGVSTLASKTPGVIGPRRIWVTVTISAILSAARGDCQTRRYQPDA
jgi:amino acid transporter